MTTGSPMIRQAGLQDVEQLVVLFCSGAKGIRLPPETCVPENRQRLHDLMRAWCEQERVWALSEADHISGMVVVERFKKGRVISGIEYVVVAESCRGQHRVGPALVRHVQTLPDVTDLRVTALNPHSRKLLENCGFWLDPKPNRMWT
ncbi:MAG TPA: GNAT family N-acetyltransferase [Stellaceae bacterium]|nr:GNAT family N-acetyltransferase [Stellaceae bacterium]